MAFDKISMSEAKKLELQGFSILHIGWFTPQGGFSLISKDLDLQSKYPDCSHVLMAPDRKFYDTDCIDAMILKEDN